MAGSAGQLAVGMALEWAAGSGGLQGGVGGWWPWAADWSVAVRRRSYIGPSWVVLGICFVLSCFPPLPPLLLSALGGVFWAVLRRERFLKELVCTPTLALRSSVTWAQGWCAVRPGKLLGLTFGGPIEGLSALGAVCLEIRRGWLCSALGSCYFVSWW